MYICPNITVVWFGSKLSYRTCWHQVRPFPPSLRPAFLHRRGTFATFLCKIDSSNCAKNCAKLIAQTVQIASKLPGQTVQIASQMPAKCQQIASKLPANCQ